MTDIDIKKLRKDDLVWALSEGKWWEGKVENIGKRPRTVKIFYIADATESTYTSDMFAMIRNRKKGDSPPSMRVDEEEEKEEEVQEVLYNGKKKNKKKHKLKKIEYTSLKANTKLASKALDALIAAREGRHVVHELSHNIYVL